MSLQRFICTAFFTLTLAFSFCIAQVNPALPKDSSVRKVIPGGQPKLIKHPAAKGFSRKTGNVHCALLDKAGHLWFGTTDDGVYRFDRKSFINFTTKDGLRDKGVYSILEDRAGNIWFGTSAGICRYDGTKITNIPIITADNNPNPGICSMLQDKNGTIWFGTSMGVYRYNGKTFSRFPENDQVINTNGLLLKNVECMLEDQSGNIWFGSGMLGGEGVCRYDGRSITNFKPNGYIWIRSMIENKNGDIWFSARNLGAFKYDGKIFTDFTEQAVSPVSDPSGNFCLSYKVGIGSLFKDSSGNIWLPGKTIRFGGEGGVWRYDGKSCTNYSDNDVFRDIDIWCMVEDKAGNIWMGTNDTGLYRFDGKTFTCFSE